MRTPRSTSSRSQPRRHFTATLAALLTALLTAALTVTAAPAARADLPGPENNVDYVSFGDSFATNTPMQEWLEFYVNRAIEGGDSEDAACINHEGNYPRRAAAIRGYSHVDYSCNGNRISDGLPETIGQAVRAGTLGPRTKVVTLQIGIFENWNSARDDLDFGDLFLECLNPGCATAGPLVDGLDADGIIARLKYPMELLRAYAPNAEIVILSYPTMTADGNLCLPTPFGPYFPPNSGGWVEYELRLAYNLWVASQHYGTSWIDLRELSLNNGPCSADPWMNGIIWSQIEAMPIHPTTRGHEVIAELVAARI